MEPVLLVVLIVLSVLVSGGLVFFVLRRRSIDPTAFNDLQRNLAIAEERLLAREATIATLQEEKQQLENELDTLKPLSALLEHKEQEMDRLLQEIQQLRQRQDQLSSENTHLKEQISALGSQLSFEKEQSQEKIALLQSAREQLTLEFQNLAHKIFNQESRKFSEQNKTSLDALLMPFREQLSDFRKKVEEVHEKESRERHNLFFEINHLKQLNLRISEDAINLTRALKGENKTQGNWGEMVLERVLESSGLQKGREYETQGAFRNEEGRSLKPDVVVHLPENRDIVIDSKMTLVAYERYCSTDDEDQKQAFLQEHVQSLKKHISDLSGKNYASLYGIRSLDYVLLFMPVEAAFLTALEADPAVFQAAFEKDIIIVCPSTLLVTLKTIQNIWRFELQNRNALEIADKAGALHDQFVLFMESLNEVGDRLGKAQDAWQTAYKRLGTGRGNLVNRVKQLEKLGAKTRKKLEPVVDDTLIDPVQLEEDIDND